MTLKVTDSNQQISEDSRAHHYWKAKGFNKLYKDLRPGLPIPRGLNNNNIDSVVKQFQLKGIAFGNWCTIEDKLNYLHVLFLSLYDLNKVLRFRHNMGLSGNLSVTFGDRGTRSGIAHFNPNTVLININRYSRGEDEKVVRFLSTGGIHSFSHEYGHFLDFVAGALFEQQRVQFSCTGWQSISRSRLGYNSPIRRKFDDILEKIIWNKGKLTPYYQQLLKRTEASGNGVGNYWIYRAELFARAFEMYVQYELAEMDISNFFLTKLAYESWAYMPQSQLKTMVNDFRELITLIRKKI